MIALSVASKGLQVQQQLTCQFELNARLIEVWCINAVTSNTTGDQFFAVLNADERNRAGQFRFDSHRNTFIAARGALRILLGRYLNAMPHCINFSYGPRGKPNLATSDSIHFNVSHSGALVLIAFTFDCDLGIDVEHIRHLPDLLDIASRFFCAEEAAQLKSLAAHERESAFFRCWTRKEAYIKAIGDGLHVPLNSFHVILQRSQPVHLAHASDSSEAAKAWNLHDLTVTSGYAAALAYRDILRPVRVQPVVEASELLAFV